MPNGVMRWFDPRRGEGIVTHLGRDYAVRASDVEPHARVSGARVHFDHLRDDGVDRAVHVRHLPGRRTNRRQRRFGDLTGAHGPDDKGGTSGARTRPRGQPRPRQPTEVAQTWLAALGSRDLVTAQELYAPDVVLHLAGETHRGRAAVDRWLDRTPLSGQGLGATVHTRGDAMATVTWTPRPWSRHRGLVRLRIEHGRITEQWVKYER